MRRPSRAFAARTRQACARGNHLHTANLQGTPCAAGRQPFAQRPDCRPPYSSTRPVRLPVGSGISASVILSARRGHVRRKVLYGFTAPTYLVASVLR